MTESNHSDSTVPDCDDRAFLFPLLPLGSPLEELETTAQGKLQTFSNLGDAESVRKVERALELARGRLADLLSSPRLKVGS